jgi:PPOX class probable F420-dependent enzyme
MSRSGNVAFAALRNEVRSFLDDVRFATIATLGRSGVPHQAVVWYALRGDEIIICSAVGRRWPSNLAFDPHISFAVTDKDDGYRWIGLSGLATPTGDPVTALADSVEMARRYLADDPAEAERIISHQYQRQVRICFRVRVTEILNHL